MMVETVIALLAIGRIGAIAVPVFPDTEISAIESRVNAVKAKHYLPVMHFRDVARNSGPLKLPDKLPLGVRPWSRLLFCPMGVRIGSEL
ncbi:MAG: hypothetical protein IPP63_18185 [Chloracidobacterium sp.]|nr:hypothetical protein [Chloracidobacterium sp.]